MVLAPLQALATQPSALATLVVPTAKVIGAATTNTMSKTGLLPSNGPVVTLLPSKPLLVVIEIGA